MSLTRAEFLRLLPVAVGHEAWQLEGDEISGEGGRPPWRIRLAEHAGKAIRAGRAARARRHARSCEDAGEAERAAFVARFLLGYQRAGG